MATDDVSIRAAHEHCIHNHDEIMASELCGCFCCLKIYSSKEITEWLESFQETDNTAFCPHCFMDTVIGTRSRYPITREFLISMQKYYGFEGGDQISN